MVKIRDAFKCFSKGHVTKNVENRAITEEEKTVINMTDQLVKSCEEPSVGKVDSVLNQVKENMIDPITELVNKHPNLSTIIPTMIAGGVTGYLVKNVQERKETAGYLKGVDKFTKKISSSHNYMRVAPEHPLVAKLPVMAFFLGMPALITQRFALGLSLMVGGAVGIAVSMLLNHHKMNNLSSDKRSVRNDSNQFVTLPPPGDKLVFYELNDKEGEKPVLKDVVKLDRKAAHLSLDKNKEVFYVNYKDGSMMTEFSLDGKKRTDINLMPQNL